MTGRPRKLSDADLERAARLYLDGMPAHKVAAAVGVSRSTLVRRFKQPYKQPDRRS